MYTNGDNSHNTIMHSGYNDQSNQDSNSEEQPTTDIQSNKVLKKNSLMSAKCHSKSSKLRAFWSLQIHHFKQ